MRLKQRIHERFMICVNNDDYLASLELWKVYRTLTDADAERHHLVRVVDESGEDYVYPDTYFAPIKLPRPVKKAMRSKRMTMA